MRSRFSIMASLAFALAYPMDAAGQRPFEGVIAYTVNAGGRSMTLRQMSRGKKIRQEIEGPGMPGPMFLLMDLEGQVIQTVMPSMGMYMEMDLAQAAQMAEGMGVKTDRAPKFTKVGTSAVIAGIRCANYRFGEAQDTEACIATGMGWFMNAPSRDHRPGPGVPSLPDLTAYRKEFKEGMLPLRVSRLENGKWEVLMEATAVERKSLDAGLFELPPGLRKMTMPRGDA